MQGFDAQSGSIDSDSIVHRAFCKETPSPSLFETVYGQRRLCPARNEWERVYKMIFDKMWNRLVLHASASNLGLRNERDSYADRIFFFFKKKDNYRSVFVSMIKKSSFWKFLNFCCVKLFFYVYLFINIKINFKKIKKYYFNKFQDKNHFKKQSPP